MKQYFKIALFFLCQLFFYNSFSQYHLLPDSIKNRLDTMNAKRADKFLISKTWAIMNTDPALAMRLANAHYEKGITLKDSSLMANACVSKGTIYQVVGDFPKSINQLLSAVKIYSQLRDSVRLAIAYNNLGNTYRAINDFENALKCQGRSLQIRLAINDSMRIRSCYLNIATIAFSKKDFAAAKIYTQKAMQHISKSRSETITTYVNYAGILAELNQYDSALYYANKIKSLIKNDTSEIAMFEITIAGIYSKEKDLQKAEYHFLNGVRLFEAIGDVYSAAAQHQALYELYKQKGDYKTALKYYELITAQKDSANNQSKNLQVAFMNAEFDVNQKEAEIKNLKQKSVLDEQEKSRIKIVRNSVIGGIILILLLAFVSYKRSLERKRLSEEITQKNLEITDSINYAKRIQDAILPSENLIKTTFSDYFILYKPKDIIAGDFYWMEENEDSLWFAVADCTGHGVPGALVSVVCSNALNNAVKEFRITRPGEILNKVRDIIIETFSKSNSNVKDGMDISLVHIAKKTIGSEKVKIQWAGANNSLYVYTNDQFIKTAATKQPIGFTHNPVPFQTHEFELNKNDIIYFFTDGFSDQFGGPKGKKFKYKQLTGHIIEMASKPLEEQKRILAETLNNWQGNLEQVDDVCVVGIKI